MESTTKENQIKRITPMNDLMAKKVLASEENKDILAGLVKDFFGITCDEIIIKNPYDIKAYTEKLKESDGDYNVLRETIRDIGARFTHADLTAEVQVKNQRHYDARSLKMAFDAFTANYNSYGMMEQGNKYSSLRPVYALSILGERHFTDMDPLRIFTLYDRKREKSFEKEWLSIGYFEILKENAETVNQEYWRQYFLGNEIPDAAPDYIHRAREAADFMNMDNDEKRIAYLADIHEQDLLSQIQYAEDKVMEKVARNLLSKGYAVEEIAETMEITPEEVLALTKDNTPVAA
jgi:hypothetical protein